MNRVLAVACLALGLLFTYAVRAPQVDAQARSFPYAGGDSIRIDYADGQTRATCIIEQFYGSFVSCKAVSRAFGASDATPRIVYNLDTAISVSLVKRAE